LYDLANDIVEKNDVANQFPSEVKKLASLLGKTLKDRNALMSVEKATGNAVPFPDETTMM
jgi:hypothetical protein